jgi:hypothetical protein
MASIWDRYTPPTKEKSIWDKYTPPGQTASEFDFPLEPTTPEKLPTRNPLAMVNDYVIEAANAVLGFGKAITDFAQPGTELSAMIEDLIQKGQESQSLVAQQSKQRLGEGIDKGGLAALGAVVDYGLTSPGLAVSQAAGSFAIPFGAVRSAQIGAKALGAGRTGVSRAGMVGGSAAGAAGAGGDAAGDAYEMTLSGLLNQGVSEDEARQIAIQAAREASVVPAIIGGAGGVIGAERLLFGRAAGAVGGRSILRTAGVESLQEAFEEGATKASANIAAGQYIEGIDPMKGVVGSAALGGLLGGITGGGVAALTNRQPKSLLRGSNDNLPGNESPSGQAIGNAINAGEQATQVETDPNKIPREVAPGIFFTPATGVYTTDDGRDITESVGRARSAAARPPAENLQMVGAGAPAVDVNQMTLPGMPPVMQPQPQPQVRPPAAPQMGAQPGQLELFFPNGEPTYGAAGPSLTNLALQRLRLEGAAPTKIRMPIAERAEDLFSNGWLDETEHDNIYAMLRDSKYGQIERFLKGVENARREQEAQQAPAGMGAVPEQAGTGGTISDGGRPDDRQLQSLLSGGVPEGSPSQQDVAAGISGARSGALVAPAGGPVGDGGAVSGQIPDQGQVSQEEQAAAAEWDGEFRTDEKAEPTFAELSPERRAVWTTAVNNNQATGELFDALVSVHNKEKKSAVQKRETKEVPVRKRAAGGQEVGKGDTKERKAPAKGKAETEEKVSPWSGKLNKDGQATGIGTYSWTDGDKFVGEMRAGKVWNGVFTPKGGKPQKVEKGAFVSDAVERRGPTGVVAGGNTKEQVDKWFAPILKAWTFAPKVNVVQSVADLDPAMKASPTAKGAFSKGEIWIVADNATSKLDVMTTLFHEAVGHFGLRSLVRAYSTEYINLMDGVARENPRVRTEAKKWRDENADRQAKLRLTSAQFRALSIEEAMADMAYQTLRNPALNVLSRSPALTRLVKWIAGRVKALGMGELAARIDQFTADVDVYRLLSMSRNAVTSGNRTSETNPEDNPLFSSFNQSARWSTKRINNLLSTWAYRNDENDTKAYAGFVNPQEFLDATSTEAYQREVLEGENKALDIEALAGEIQPIFLSIEQGKLGADFSRIVGHEGRHRMMALRDAGVQRVPVVFLNGYAGQRVTDAKPIDFGFFYPQAKEGDSALSVSNLIPISYANKEKITDVFGEGTTQADIVFRDAGEVTPAERSEIGKTISDFAARLNPMNYSKGRRAVLGLRFLTDIRDNLAGQLPGLRSYVERSLAMGATTNELLKESSQIANRWASLGKEAEALNKLAAAATASDIHPDVPLDQQEHTSGFSQDGKPARKVTNRHLFKEDGTVADPETENNYKIISKMFADLSPAAKRVYYEARDYMHKNWQRRQELLNKNVDTVFQPLIAEAKRVGNQAKVKELEKERRTFIREYGRLLSEVKGPYFPLSRFGEYYVTYKSDAYQNVEKDLNEANQLLSDLYSKYEIPVSLKKETEAATRAFVKFGEDPVVKLSESAKKEISEARKKVREFQNKLDKMVREGDKHFVSQSFESEVAAGKRADELGVPVRLAEEHFRELNPVNKAFIDKLSSAVGGALPQEQALKTREAMYQIYLAALPQTSALKNEMKRRGVAGWDGDMQRAFADYSQKDAHYLSRLEHVDEMTSDLLQMRRNKKTGKQDEIYNEIARRHAASLKYHQSPIEDGLSSLAFIYQLGISPAFLLTNMSQPWMISMPFMSGRHGVAKVTSELAKGFADAGKAASTAVKEQGWFFEIDLNKFSGKEKEMLEAAMKAGLLDISLAVDIGAYAQGGRTGVSKVTHAMGVLPHQVEVLNRTMTALAAYRLEIQKGSSQQEATDYALRTLDKTHLNYSSTNAPYYLKPGVVPFGKVLFQYRKFQLGMLTLMANQIKQAYKGDATARKEARRTLLGIFGMHALMTGAVGLPAVGSIMFIANIINAIFGDEDEPFDAETEFRRFLADSFGVEEGLVLAKGLPTLLGVDLSRNIGLGDITAPIRVLRSDKEGRDLYLEVLAAGLGPTIGGLGPQFTEGIQMLMKGDIYRGVEGLTPRFFRDWTRAVRLSEEGLTTKTGQTIFQPEEISAWDTAIQAVGFPSTKISERGAAAGAVQKAKQTIQDRRSQLTRAFVEARKDNDREAMAEVQREIAEFNRKRLEKREPTLKPRDLLNAYKQRQRYTRDLNPQGVSLARSERAFGEYGAFAAVR